MKNNIESIRAAYEYIGFISIGDYICFKDFEVYNTITEEIMQFNSLEEMLEAKIEGKKIIYLMQDITFEWNYGGGRGAGSGGPMGGGFTSAGSDGSGESTRTPLFPAQLNTQGRFTTQEGALRRFAELYKDADREYGISVDPQGFVHRHVQGTATQVGINAAANDHLVIHNHPGGGAFSKADMQVLAHDTRSSGIVAVGTKNTYTVMKSKTFKPKEFVKAVNRAKWPAQLDYDAGVDWWLKKNAGAFGYSYSRTRTS